MADFSGYLGRALSGPGAASMAADNVLAGIAAKYKRNVGDWNQQKLDEAQAVAQKARTDKEAELNRIAREKAQADIDQQTALAGGIAAKKAQDRAAFIAMLPDDVNKEAMADDAEKAMTAEEVAAALNKHRVKGRKDAKDVAKAFQGYAMNPLHGMNLANATTTGWTGSRQGQTGAVNIDTLADAYKRDILDYTPDYLDVGDKAFVRKLEESTGARASIDAELPDGAKPVSAALAEARKRLEEREKNLQFKAVENKAAREATSSDKAQSYLWKSDYTKERDQRLADAKMKLQQERDRQANLRARLKNETDLRRTHMVNVTARELQESKDREASLTNIILANQEGAMEEYLSRSTISPEALKEKYGRMETGYGLEGSQVEGSDRKLRVVSRDAPITVDLGPLGTVALPWGSKTEKQIKAMTDEELLANYGPAKAARKAVPKPAKKERASAGASIYDPTLQSSFERAAAKGKIPKVVNPDGTTTYTTKDGETHTFRGAK